MSTVTIRVVDLETTDEPPDAAVCEAGWCDLIIAGEARVIIDPVRTFVDPGRPITPSARGVHHISDADVAGAPTFDEVSRRIVDGPPTYFAAHRAEFEQFFIPRVFVGDAETQWIDTWKVALRLWADLKDQKNQTLRYHLGFDEKIEGFTEKAMPPHRAAPDAFATAHLVNVALDFAPIEQLVAWSAEPALMPKITFGKKHRGELWTAVPSDYLDWIIRDGEGLDADTKWNAQHELDRRLEERRAEYVIEAYGAIDKVDSIDALERWWTANAGIRADLKIEKGTPAYQRIVTAGTDRRAALTAQADSAAPSEAVA